MNSKTPGPWRAARRIPERHRIRQVALTGEAVVDLDQANFDGRSLAFGHTDPGNGIHVALRNPLISPRFLTDCRTATKAEALILDSG
jgi:hypothetical protein